MAEKEEKSSPFQYEEVFLLMLNMYHQFVFDRENPEQEVQNVEKYFYRLTRLALGEFEFARRLAFEGLKVNRLAHYDIISKIYKQYAPEDFIISKNGVNAFVDVKFYDKNSLKENVILNTRDIELALINAKNFKIDLAFLAIKRYNRWYLVEAQKIKDYHKPNKNSLYFVDIDFLRANHRDDFLKEEPVCLNLGSQNWIFKGSKITIQPPKDNSLLKSVDLYSFPKDQVDRNKIEFKIWNESGQKVDIFEDGYRAKILWTIFYTLQDEIKNLLIHQEIKQIDELSCYTDILPTEFSITDSLITSGVIEIDCKQNGKDRVRKFLTQLYNGNYITNAHLEYMTSKTWVMFKSKINKDMSSGS
jgi:hypothetical protein